MAIKEYPLKFTKYNKKTAFFQSFSIEKKQLLTSFLLSDNQWDCLYHQKNLAGLLVVRHQEGLRQFPLILLHLDRLVIAFAIVQ